MCGPANGSDGKHVACVPEPHDTSGGTAGPVRSHPVTSDAAVTLVRRLDRAGGSLTTADDAPGSLRHIPANFSRMFGMPVTP